MKAMGEKKTHLGVLSQPTMQEGSSPIRARFSKMLYPRARKGTP